MLQDILDGVCGDDGVVAISHRRLRPPLDQQSVRLYPETGLTGRVRLRTIPQIESRHARPIARSFPADDLSNIYLDRTSLRRTDSGFVHLGNFQGLPVDDCKANQISVTRHRWEIFFIPLWPASTSAALAMSKAR